MWWVYIVKCADDTLYTGVTTDVERRVRQHNGEIVGGAKYTKVRRPVELVHKEESLNRSEAGKREYEIKQLSAAEKSELGGS